ncbi:MAG: UDP-3-O-acyl-N-acetylglucosamine deacetylase [Gemmatales bacterium]|nr:UDP-3-O-acyl-N-acetylglucosamine deacetylase [Gemmatales bacterium]MDW7994241.1 UDP-3-O-acyl-N-acetylglucosamine deacetylase [Gemmatales bacterium]
MIELFSSTAQSSYSCNWSNNLEAGLRLEIVGWRRQRTLAKPVELHGRGLLYGKPVCLRLLPAEPNTGRLFVRTDLGRNTIIPAVAETVTATERRTILGLPPAQVELVEHVLAALAGLMIDNCRIELTGPEPPGWDGSVKPLVQALKETAFVAQDAELPIVAVRTPVDIRDRIGRLVLLPATATELRLDYFLDYGTWSPIPPQRFSCRLTPQEFVNTIAASRTFLLLEEVQTLRQQGVGLHTGPERLLVFSAKGVVGNRLRWANEPARHKTLDLIGDLALVGCPLAGHIVAYRSGHRLNIQLARQLRAAVHALGWVQQLSASKQAA